MIPDHPRQPAWVEDIEIIIVVLLLTTIISAPGVWFVGWITSPNPPVAKAEYLAGINNDER